MRDLIPMECLKLLYKMVFGLNSNEFNTLDFLKLRLEIISFKI